jgi:hypothetical protein
VPRPSKNNQLQPSQTCSKNCEEDAKKAELRKSNGKPSF